MPSTLVPLGTPGTKYGKKGERGGEVEVGGRREGERENEGGKEGGRAGAKKGGREEGRREG